MYSRKYIDYRRALQPTQDNTEPKDGLPEEEPKGSFWDSVQQELREIPPSRFESCKGKIQEMMKSYLLPYGGDSKEFALLASLVLFSTKMDYRDLDESNVDVIVAQLREIVEEAITSPEKTIELIEEAYQGYLQNEGIAH